MKNIFVLLLTAFALASCKVSDSVTANGSKNSGNQLVYDQVSKSSELANKKTFKVIEQANATKDILQLNRMFEKKLVENGYVSQTENPDLLVQTAISSVNIETEKLGFGILD